MTAKKEARANAGRKRTFPGNGNAHGDARTSPDFVAKSAQASALAIVIDSTTEPDALEWFAAQGGGWATGVAAFRQVGLQCGLSVAILLASTLRRMAARAPLILVGRDPRLLAEGACQELSNVTGAWAYLCCAENREAIQAIALIDCAPAGVA